MGISIVVPNAFNQFAENENVLLYGDLMEMLNADEPSTGPLSGQKLIAGQGLDEKQISHALQVGTSKGLTAEFEHWNLNQGKQLATKSLVHKHRPENTLISTPERTEDGNFVAELILHEQNELLLDHSTGQHVQGIVLTEACRQMVLAVTEKFCLHDYTAPKRYFVVKTMTMRFQSFAFPLPAKIHYRILDQQQQAPDRIAIHADMDIYQGGQAVTGMEVKFTVFDNNIIDEREKMLAATAVQHYIEEVSALLSASSDDKAIPTLALGEKAAV